MKDQQHFALKTKAQEVVADPETCGTVPLPGALKALGAQQLAPHESHAGWPAGSVTPWIEKSPTTILCLPRVWGLLLSGNFLP